MESKFDLGLMDEILEKALKDDTGELSSVINDLILLGRKAGHAGFSLKEIATLVTVGYYVSREPELESLVKFLLSKTQPHDDYLN